MRKGKGGGTRSAIAKWGFRFAALVGGVYSFLKGWYGASILLMLIGTDLLSVSKIRGLLSEDVIPRRGKDKSD